MMPLHRLRRISSQPSFLVVVRHNLLLSIGTLFAAGFLCLAQSVAQTENQAPPPSEAGATAPNSTVTVPPGTRIALVLAHPIQSRNMHRGDDVYAQVASPVASGSDVAIPPGTFLQGKLEKLERKGGRALLHLESLSLTYPNNYVVHILGPAVLESTSGYAVSDPGGGRVVGAFVLPMAGAGLGTLIGHAAGGKGTNIGGMNWNPDGQKATMIGAMVGSAAGGVGSLLMIAVPSRNFFLDVWSPVELVLQRPLSLERDKVADAVMHSNSPQVRTIPLLRPAIVATQSPFDCPTGQEWCSGRCMSTMDFVSDSGSCGRCGNRCSISETCTGGSCTCAPAYSMCMGSCVSDASFSSDSSNCGRCGNHCSFGETCTGGTCMKLTP